MPLWFINPTRRSRGGKSKRKHKSKITTRDIRRLIGAPSPKKGKHMAKRRKLHGAALKAHLKRVGKSRRRRARRNPLTAGMRAAMRRSYGSPGGARTRASKRTTVASPAAPAAPRKRRKRVTKGYSFGVYGKRAKGRPVAKRPRKSRKRRHGGSTVAKRRKSRKHTTRRRASPKRKASARRRYYRTGVTRARRKYRALRASWKRRPARGKGAKAHRRHVSAMLRGLAFGRGPSKRRSRSAFKMFSKLNPGENIKKLMKTVAFTAGGFYGARIVSNKLGELLAANVPQVAGYGKLIASGALLLGAVMFGRKIPVVKNHLPELCVGIGLQLADQAINQFAPASVKGFIGSGDAYDVAYLPYEQHVGDYVETGLDQDLGDYVETGAMQDMAAEEDLGSDQRRAMVPRRALTAGVPSVAMRSTVPQWSGGSADMDDLYTGVFANRKMW
jgi:hypothetical protein